MVAGDVFNKCFGSSSGPDILFFKKFKQQWHRVDQASFQICDDARLCNVREQEKDFLMFAMSQLREEHAKEGYCEFLELTVVFSW